MAHRKRAFRAAAFPSPPVGDERSPLAASLRQLAAVVGGHRRLLASVCAGAAVVVAVSALTSPAAGVPPADSGRAAGPVLVPAGAGDRPADSADRVAVAVRLADPAGLLLVRAGSHAEVLAGPAPDVGSVPAASGPSSAGSPGEVLVADAVVLAVPQPPGTAAAAASGAGASRLLGSPGAAGGSTGLEGVVVLAVPPSDARRLAAAAGTRPLSVAVGLAAAS